MVVRLEAKDVSATPLGSRAVLWLGRGAVPAGLRKLAASSGFRLCTRSEEAWPPQRIALLENLGVTSRDNTSLQGRRVAVLHPDPGAADALAEAVRAKGARAVVLSLSEVGITRAEALDPEVIVLSPTHMAGACASMVDALWAHPRMRWTPMLLVPDERLGPAGLNAPDVRELAIAVGTLCAEHVMLERRSQRELQFELPLHQLGPVRLLRSLLESGRSLHLTFQSSALVVEVDLAENIVVGARAGEQRAEEEMLLGVHALTALFSETAASVRVKRVERPHATNIMAPLDALLLGDRRTPAFISDAPVANTQMRSSGAEDTHHEPDTLRPPPKVAPVLKEPAPRVLSAPTPAHGTKALPPVRKPASGLPALRAPGEPSTKQSASSPRVAPPPSHKSTLLMAGPPRSNLAGLKAGRPGPLFSAPERTLKSELEDAIASALDEQTRPTGEFAADKPGAKPVEIPQPPVQIAKVIATARIDPVLTQQAPQAVAKIPAPPAALQAEEKLDANEIEISISEPDSDVEAAPIIEEADALETAKTREFAAADEPTEIGITYTRPNAPGSRRWLWAVAAVTILGVGAGTIRMMQMQRHTGGKEAIYAKAPPLPTEVEVAVAAAAPADPAPTEATPQAEPADTELAKGPIDQGSAADPEAVAQAHHGEPEAQDEDAPAEPADANAQGEEAPAQGEQSAKLAQEQTASGSPDTVAAASNEPTEESWANVPEAALARANEIVLKAHKHKRGGDLAVARATYEKALEVVPGYPRALFGIAEIELARGEPQHALATALELLKRRKRFPDDYRLLGDIHAALGNTQDALTAYRVASQGGSRVARDKLRAMQ